MFDGSQIVKLINKYSRPIHIDLTGPKLRKQAADPQMEIQADLSETLPEDLVCSILTRLPVRALARMRIVCKRWNSLLSPGDALQRLDPNFSINSITGFLIQLISWDPRDLETWAIELVHGSSYINIYTSLLPNNQIVVAACQSICCCHREGDKFDISIGNPATGTWRTLPRPAHVNQAWHFIGMTLDSTSRRYTVLLGENNVRWRPQGSVNSMALNIYDSESNAWTRVSMRVNTFIRPLGEGLYSKGNFYWVIKGDAIYFMVAFDIAERTWTEIAVPEVCRTVFRYPGSLYLSGCHGRVVLIQEERRYIRMWRLNEGQGTADWCEVPEIYSPERNTFYSVVANNGWAMIIDYGMQIYLCNPELMVSLRGRLGGSNGYSIRFLSAFESNVLWP